MDNFNNFGNNDTNSTSEIHIYVHQRGTRKADTIIKGLEFADKDESKKFLSSIKQAFGINGCIKTIEEIDPDNKFFHSRVITAKKLKMN